jgi:outer membrane protein OmpA-like peptidoglycan-associated protein
MRSIRTLIFASVFAVPAVPALAQMYPGQDVTVNPSAIGAVPYRYSAAPIHLHMPVHRHVVHHHAAVAAAAPAATPPKAADATPPASPPATTPMIGTMADTAAPPAAPAKHHAPAPAKTAAASPPPAPPADVYSGTGMDGAVPFSLDGVHTVTPAKQAPQKSAPTKTAATAQTAPNIAPQPAATQAGMTKRGEILFNKGATDPAPAQFDGLKLLAGDLSEALKTGASRIQLEAFGGNRGDKGSDARRLSLKRALSIRQVLIDNGVPSNVIDVRAMGGAEDSGPADRVDVYVRAS